MNDRLGNIPEGPIRLIGADIDPLSYHSPLAIYVDPSGLHSLGRSGIDARRSGLQMELARFVVDHSGVDGDISVQACLI